MEEKQIIEKLNHIQSDLDYIKSHITDVDLVLTEDDFKALEEADKDLTTSKTKRI